MTALPKLAVIGSGVWGTALATLAEQSGQTDITSWSRRSSQAIAEVVDGTDFMLSAVSMKGVLPTIQNVQPCLNKQIIIITATKGLDADTLQTPSQLWQQAFPENPVVVLSGPNLSKEIMQNLPAATTVSSVDSAAAESVQKIFSSPKFRVYVNPDPLGTELGGTLKNIMAIATGVCDGMALGTNARAGLITRALQEIIRVGVVLGAKPETFVGLSGLGDLIATCESPLSRNYQVGFGLAQGKSVDQILEELVGTAEGINTTNVVMAIAQKFNVDVPITQQVHRLLQGKTTSAEAMQNLMGRHTRPEFADLSF